MQTTTNSLPKLSELSLEQKDRLREITAELQRRKIQERARYFIPVKPDDPNGFGEKSNDQHGFIHSTADERFVFGGNRSGKTEVAVQDCVLFCTGKHPIRDRRPPVKVRYCAPKWRDGVLGVVLQKFKEIVPRRELRGGSFGKAWSEKEHRLHFKNGSFIHFKTDEEDLDTFGGADLDACYQDERLSEPRFRENKMRLVERNGFYVAAMTPEAGITWERDHVENPPDGVSVAYWFFDMRGNPHLPTEAVRKAMSSIRDSRLRKTKIEGKFVALGGLVLPQWNRDRHIVPDYEIPKEWPRGIMIDTHHKTPSALLCYAWTPKQELVVYRTKKMKATVPEWKRWIKTACAGERFNLWGLDEPGSGSDVNKTESICKQFNNHDEDGPLPFVQVPRHEGSFNESIYKLWDMLSVDPTTNETKVQVFESCNYPVEYIDGKPHGSLVWEIEQWQYKTEQKADEETLREKVRDVNNHYISDLRYAVLAGPVRTGGRIRSALDGSW